MLYKKISVKKSDKKVKSSTKNKLLDELLALRNVISKKSIENFLNFNKEALVSPYVYCDMERAKKRILKAVKEKQNILIWGDFDCDGVTSSAILYKALKKLDANVEAYIPDRLKEGHGLNSKELLKRISKDKIKLVITVDCGSSNVSEVNLLKGLKVDTIITDHHTIDTEIPPAYAVINPQIKGAIKEETDIEDIVSLSYNSGSYTAYKLAITLIEDIEDEILKDELKVIAACGLIADVVPLLQENRVFVEHALEILNKKKTPKAIYNLIKSNMGQIEKDITSTDIAFILAPRINAVGRLTNASLSFEFLTSQSDTRIDIISQELNNYNKIRQSKCDETYQDIKNYLSSNKSELNNSSIVLFNPDWHIGIIGIAASRIVEEYNKPCFLMTKDENNYARCSIRSNNLINVYEILKENAQYFKGFGGHKLAGGLSFDLSQYSFETVKENLLKTIDENHEENLIQSDFICDIELEKNDLTVDILETIKVLEPFGEQNKEPVFCLRSVILKDYNTMGKEKNHLKMIFSKDDMELTAVKWQENELKIPKGVLCDIAFFIRLNDFNGVQSLQLEILDIYSSSYIENKEENKKDEFKLFDHRKKINILPQVESYFKDIKGKFDIGIWAKTPKIKEELSKYQTLKDNFIVDDAKKRRGIMFFDYPSSKEELYEILSNIEPKKVHFMNYTYEISLEKYIKQLVGMIKYCTNKLDGNFDIRRMSYALGLSETFLNLAFEIMENLGSIKIKNNKIEYIKSFDFEQFKSDTLFEIIEEEFKNILDFKKTLTSCETQELADIVESIIN